MVENSKANPYDRQWFKSVAGWQITELPMAKSLCGEVLKAGKLVIVKNALEDLYLMNNPLVLRKPKIRFYAGYPIKDSDGNTIGTFCVMDPDAAPMITASVSITQNIRLTGSCKH